MSKKYLAIVLISFWMLPNGVFAQCDITPNKYKGCKDDIFEFSIIPKPSSYSSIMWNFGDGDSSNQMTSTISHIFSYWLTHKDTFGVFTVCVTLRNASGNIICRSCINITIYDSPEAIIQLSSPYQQLLAGNNFHFTDASIPGKNNFPILKRLWNFGDGITDTVKSPVHTYSATGAYRVMLTVNDSNGGFDTANTFVSVVDSFTTIKEWAKFSEINVFPNPFMESVNVYLPSGKEIKDIELLDLSGKSILIRKTIKGENMEIFRDGLPRGMYILKIVSDKVYVYKIIAE